MQVILNGESIRAELAQCEVGDRKVIHWTVTSKGPEVVVGEATQAYYEEGEPETPVSPTATPTAAPTERYGPTRGARVAAPVRAMMR